MNDQDALKNLPKLKPRGFAGPATTEGFAADTEMPSADRSKPDVRTETTFADDNRFKGSRANKGREKKAARASRQSETQLHTP